MRRRRRRRGGEEEKKEDNDDDEDDDRQSEPVHHYNHFVFWWLSQGLSRVVPYSATINFFCFINPFHVENTSVTDPSASLQQLHPDLEWRLISSE